MARVEYAAGPGPSQPGAPRESNGLSFGAMLGGGIAFHTAFAVFGIQRFVDYSLEGLVGILPWVLPAMIGVPATAIWTRHYRRKFGEDDRSIAPARAVGGRP